MSARNTVLGGAGGLNQRDSSSWCGTMPLATARGFRCATISGAVSMR